MNARAARCGSQPGKQSGLALVIVLGFLVMAAITTAVAYWKPRSGSGPWDGHTEEVLNQARMALIGRAVGDDDRPGSLPCPDGNGDGIADLLVGNACASYVGRLPWRTLGLSNLRDASGEGLWYALSPSLRDDTSAEPINSDTSAQLSLNTPTPLMNIAAVVIAPGPALPWQSREAAAQNNIASYLEGGNADGDDVYQTGAISATFNDRLTIITREQLFNVVEWRVANELRARLQRYFVTHGYFPYANAYSVGTFACTNNQTRGRIPNPNPITQISATCPANSDWAGGGLTVPLPQWFFDNGWYLLTYYSLAPACTSATPNCTGTGFLTVNTATDVRAVVIVGARAFGFQPRPCTVATECIEQPLAAADGYRKIPMSVSFNDKVSVIR